MNKPTASQLRFLFREKIPIPLMLTWDEASDLIDERLNQKASKLGFIVGDKVSYLFRATGKRETGQIVRFSDRSDGYMFADICLDDGRILYGVYLSNGTLQKITADEE